LWGNYELVCLIRILEVCLSDWETESKCQIKPPGN
jgi:hypothetical protein